MDSTPATIGTRDTSHQKPHVEDRKRNRNDWNFSEWGNFHADALCDIVMKHRNPTPIAPWKLESVVPWSFSFTDNGDRIVGSILSFVTTTRQNITSATRMANSELFSCIVPVDNQRSYSADEQIDQRLMQNIWSLSETLNERKIRVLSMWGMSLSNKYLHRWKLTDSAETDIYICTICKNPDIVRVREEWAGAIHTTINDHMGHKRFQLNPAKFQNLWQTCDGEMASWSPGNAPA